uniref:Zinc knuckle domain-containing protein n=1 Tax=Canis lupus familiaris TaxID=9615 RepID=A0A8I3RTL9_CANLF
MTGHCIYQQPPKSHMAQNLKKLQRGPAGPRNSSPKGEDARVKCKNCGAFGHLASSKMCPMKCWDGALAPQPLGCNRNENLEPRRLQDFQTPGSFHGTGSRKEQRQRQEEQERKALPQTSPVRPPQKQQNRCKEPMDGVAPLRRPTRPMPIQTNKKRSVLGPVPTSQPPDKTPDMHSFCPTRPLSEAPKISTWKPAQRYEVDSPCQGLKSSTLTLGRERSLPLSTKWAASRLDVFSPDLPQSARKTLALGCGCNPQAQAKCPHVDSKAIPQPATGNCGQNSKLSIQAPGKKSPQVAIQTCQNPPKKARFSLF